MKAPHVVQPVPGSKGALVFGMEWKTHVGINVKKQGLRAAREAKASHYLATPDKGSMSVGIFREDKKERSELTLHSAAAALARLHPHEMTIVWARLPGDLVWVAATQKGIVVARTDVVYSDETEAEAALADLKERFGSKVIVLGDAPGAKELSPTALIGVLGEKTRLHSAVLQWRTLPPAAKAAVVAAVLLPAAHFAWQEWEDQQMQEARLQAQAFRFDPDEVWRKQIANFETTKVIHQRADLEMIQESLTMLPLAVDRWHLDGAKCTADGAKWRCAAIYRRASSLATNDLFIASMPSHWSTRFYGLDYVEASWDLESTSVTTLKIDDLLTNDAINTTVISRWQEVLPVLTTMSLGEPKELPIPVPEVRLQNGMMDIVNRLPWVPTLGEKDLVIEAPLRSLSVIPVNDTQLSIRTVGFRLTPDVEVSINQSILSAELTGVIYAKN